MPVSRNVCSVDQRGDLGAVDMSRHRWWVQGELGAAEAGHSCLWTRRSICFVVARESGGRSHFSAVICVASLTRHDADDCEKDT